jgi:hypothetical protein
LFTKGYSLAGRLQNGRHERLHRTLKEDTASPPARAWLNSANDSQPSNTVSMNSVRIRRFSCKPLSRCTTPSSGTPISSCGDSVRRTLYCEPGAQEWHDPLEKAERCSSQRCSRVSALGFFRRRMERSRSTSDRCTWESSKANRQHSTQTGTLCRKPKRTNRSRFPDSVAEPEHRR